MRHIVLGLSLLIALPQPIKADDSHSFLYTCVIAGIIGLVKGVQQLAAQQTRKNDILEQSIKNNSKKPIDPVTFFKMLQQTTQTHTDAVQYLVTLHQNNPLLEQQYKQLLSKGVLVHQEVSDSLEWTQQLTKQDRETFACVQEHNFTAEDLKILAALKANGYKDIPHQIIAKTKEEEYISLPGNPAIRIHKKLVEILIQETN